MDLKKLLPHAIAVAVLLLTAAIFYAPNAFSGKVLPQPDNDKARAMQTEIRYYLDKEGKAPLWTNSAFGGMPSFQIIAPVKGNLTQPVYRTMFLWQDYTSVWAQTFAAMLCMYLLMCVLGANWQLAVFGAVAYGITTYNVDILEAGHSTKMAALALTPGMLAGVVLTGRGRLLLGGGLLALFTAMQIFANHPQITYYTLLITGIFFVAQLVAALRGGAIMNWLKAAAVCGVAIGLGFAANTSRLWPTLEYSKETIRGSSELTQRNVGRGDGLTKDYLFGWSYGIGESLTLLVPRVYGGGANEKHLNSETVQALARGASPAEKKQLAQQLAPFFYCGEQDFVGTAIYYGAIICFLFALGIVLVPGQVKWWLTASAVFTISLAWGKHFFLNHIFYDYLPMFNKFRAVSMALGLGQLCFAALAALSLQSFFNPDISKEQKKRALYIALGTIVAFCIGAFIFGGGEGANDKMLGEQNPTLPGLLMNDRAAMLRADAFRSLGFVALAFGILWFALQGRLKAGVAVISIALLSLADHWLVATRNISSDKYETRKAALAPPKETPADAQIKQDKDPHYRVLDLARGAIATNFTPSYFHKSLGGYHAAKLQRFQEVVDTFLSENLADNLHITGMFNAKYIITQKGDVVPNSMALGNAWFVKHISVVPTADAEFAALHRLNPKDSAVVQQKQASALEGFNLQYDSSATIRLSSYHPDRMEYEYSAKTEQVALFSEMYYPPAKGWKCYLNGQPAPDFFKADYFLRGMRLPAGQKQKLEMRFEPKAFYQGENIARIASGLALLLFLTGLFFYFRKGNFTGETPVLTDIEPENAPEKRPATTPPPAPKNRKK
jgi:hypothetical protein